MLLPPGGLLLLTFYIIHSAGAFDSEFKTSQPDTNETKTVDALHRLYKGCSPLSLFTL